MSATSVYFLLDRDAYKLPALKSVVSSSLNSSRCPKFQGKLRRFQSAGMVWAVSQASSTGPNITPGDSLKGTMPS